MKAIIVHGGCDENSVPPDMKQRRRAGVKRACEEGHQVLQTTGSAVEAVEAAVRILEDDPIFDAGTGSFLNLIGDIEMDAMLATSDGRAGGVAAIEKVRHPISVARQVMEQTPHILLVGRGATMFARALDIPEYDTNSAEAQKHYLKQLETLSPSLSEILPRYRKIREGLKSTSTVGAVAVDDSGMVVAGTSTGGIPQKLPGRVGDSAILGAGTFASPAGGASATGVGEAIIRLNVTRALLDDVAKCKRAQQACEAVVQQLTQLNSPCGVIMLDKRGEPGTFHNGYFMPVFYSTGSDVEAQSLEVEVEEASYLAERS